MKGLTLTIVTPKIQSVNYGETIGNVSTLKKLSTGTESPKKLITYFSDKAIKFDVKRIGRDQFNWNLMNKSVVSVFVNNYHSGNFDHDKFLKDMIAQYEEFDLFGGMFADIGNVSDEIKQNITDETTLSSFINGLGEDIDITVNSESLKAKTIKEFLKLISDSAGKSISIENDKFQIDELKADNSKIKNLKSKVEAIGRRRVEIKIDGETKKKKDIEDVIKAMEAIQRLIGHEIIYRKSLTIGDTNRLKRSQPVRFSNGYSISEFVYDMNLLNDIDAYNRYIQYTAGQKKQSLVYPEEHLSYYTYTLTIDLDKVGASEKEEHGRIVFEPVIDDPVVRAKRVTDILEIVLLYLNRKIKGRDERLTPIFLIGGVYDVKHPFFANAIAFSEQNQKLHFNADDIKKIFDTYQTPDISSDTFLHFHNSFVEAKGQVPTQLENQNLQEILKAMEQKVCDYYKGKDQK